MRNPLGFFSQLLAKNDPVMSGHGVMTSFSRPGSAPGLWYVMFLVRSVSFSLQITEIMSGSPHTTPVDVTWVRFGFSDPCQCTNITMSLNVMAFLTIAFYRKEMQTRTWRHPVQVVKTHSMISVFTYFDPTWSWGHVTWGQFLAFAFHGHGHIPKYFDAFWREENDDI